MKIMLVIAKTWTQFHINAPTHQTVKVKFSNNLSLRDIKQYEKLKTSKFGSGHLLFSVNSITTSNIHCHTGKNSQAIYKASLANSFITKIQNSRFSQEILLQAQADFELSKSSYGKNTNIFKHVQSKTDLSNENPSHASISNKQLKVLHCPFCSQQIKMSLSMDPSLYSGGNCILIGLTNLV